MFLVAGIVVGIKGLFWSAVQRVRDLAVFLRVRQPAPAGTPQALRPTWFHKARGLRQILTIAPLVVWLSSSKPLCCTV